MSPIIITITKSTRTLRTVQYLPYIFNLKSCRKHCVDLSYRIIGNPRDTNTPPILIFHGLLGNKNNWQSLGKVLMKVMKRCVIPVDLRNHGWSPHSSPHTYEELAADVLKLYKKLSIEKATLIGHCMGGRTAMAVALIEPPKVDNLIVIDISPISSTSQLTELFPKIHYTMKQIDFKNHKTVGKARSEAKKLLLPVIRDDVTLKAVLMNINKAKNGKIDWTCNLNVLINDFKHIAQFPQTLKAKKYYGSTLFIGGQTSEFIPADDLCGIREIFPRAMVKYIPKAGHNLHVEDSATFLQLVISFLKLNE